MGFWSSVFSTAATIVEATVSVIKTVAIKVIDVLANDAEKFVADVKRVWRTVKPHVMQARDLLRKYSQVPMAEPWMNSALALIASALDFAIAFDESPLAKKLDGAISWVIEMARKAHKHYATAAEAAQAEAHKATFADAMREAKPEQRRAIEIADFLNNALLLRTRINVLLESGDFKDTQHYLRLRAAQRLLAVAQERMDAVQSVEDVSDDDLFLTRIGTDLLAATPQLRDADAARLEAVVKRRFGKPLVAFVFEEMQKAWATDLAARVAEQRVDEGKLADEETTLRRLKLADKIDMLDDVEKARLAELEPNVAESMKRLSATRAENHEFQIIVQATEGFLQFLEKDQATLEAEDLDYLADSGAEVGRIVIDCAEKKKRLADLSAEERMSVIDFSNIFAKASKARAKELVTVAI